MTTPGVVTTTTNTVGKVLDWKKLLYLTLLIIVLMFIVTRVMKLQINIVDNNGETVGTGSIEPKLNKKLFTIKKQGA